MRKTIRFTVLLVATVAMLALYAGSAYAYTGHYARCASCHAVRSGATVTANVGTNNGTTAEYGISTTGATEWAIFAGVTKITAGSGDATVTLPAGATYEVYAVSGNPTSGTYGSTILEVGSSLIDDVAVALDVTPPTSSSSPAAAYNGQAVIEITATDDLGLWGVEYIYYRLNGGSARVTPVGVGGKAVAYVVPTTEGTSTYTIEYWATDRAGNDEAPQSATFTVTRTITAGAVGMTSALGANGASAWSYQDLHDSSPKYEGGYVAFGGASGNYSDPHGGYNTTTNKCKVCHAVHRAAGAYYLLRADSQDDACSYCHIGSAHSTKVVYDLNPSGIYTTNGHTIGAQAQIPDSTTKQVAQEVTLKTTDASGAEVSDVIHVRAYEADKNEMYRFARHHGQSAVSYYDVDKAAPENNQSARSGYQKIGPLALRCMSCHQPHNAVNEVWRPRAFAPFNDTNYGTTVDGAFDADGYKLLRRAPSGTTIGEPNYTSATDPVKYYGYNQVVKAIEDQAVKGTNFSGEESGEFEYKTSHDVTRSAPVWIAQDIHATSDANPEVGVYRYPNKVNTMALSWWCADCHNLNIGGWEPLADPELGFKAHTERTHPAPFYGAYTGPGQCYSCHRNDLAPQMGLTDAANPTGGATSPALLSSRNGCTQCHYGTADYYVERGNSATARSSDFPHSGSASDIKLLGAYNVTGNPNGSWAPTYNAATVTGTTLDQVCLRCHPGIGFNH